MIRPSRLRTLALAALTSCAVARAVPAAAGFVEFESGQVRPLALSPDGTRLFAVNTPDDRLEIFTVGAGGLVHTDSVPVGLEPVAVAARTNGEVWVVNHLSDSVSIVDVSMTPPRVVRTLLVGDEPRDLVFAGPGGTRAFVTTAHRGQNNANDPQLTTPGVGRADVWVFDAQNLGATLGGTPLTIVTLFGDTPRALAASPDGNTVYAAVFDSGNQTATVSEGVVCNGGSTAAACTIKGVQYPGGLPAPNKNFEGTTGPETGLVVKLNPATGHWEDRLGRDWSHAIRFSLPDKDVFAIDAAANPPAETAFFTSVGTVLFNMATNPVTGKVYVSNTDAHNEVRFEGPGGGGSTVRGHLAEARITVLDGSNVLARHLNKHIDYAVVPSPAGTADKSLATPTGMAVTANGATLYVAAFGSSKVGVFSTAALENDTFVPDAANHITVTGGGPSGLVLDEPHGRLYVFTRFDNAVSVIDTATNTETEHLPVHNPEPPSVVAGRPFLYDAHFTSSNGEAACASCHIFGDFDSLAWDLGNPDDPVKQDFNPVRLADPLNRAFPGFHPLKGPMTTQSLRGMANNGPMHWRGDRTGATFNGDPNGLSEDLAFKAFNVAFGGLLGRSGPLTASEMQAFTDFILQVTYPPNPIRALDNSLTTDQQAGKTFFTSSSNSDVVQPCHGCHAFDPSQGQFGTDGFQSFENEPQNMKIPHLRNLYQKVGMFGMPATQFINDGNNGCATGAAGCPTGASQPPQVRGFGFLHDGSVDTLLRFHNATVFNQTNAGGLGVNNPGGFPNDAPGDPLRKQVEQFMLAFDSNLAPIVGQQITLAAGNAGVVGPRITLMIQRAAAGECDLIVKGNLLNASLVSEPRGWVRNAGGMFQSDSAADSPISDSTLRSQAKTAGQERTYTCVPPGSGTRLGIDRDEDGALDYDEILAGTDPADPSSVPGSTLIQTTSLSLRDRTSPPNPAARRVSFRSNTKPDPAAHRIVAPLPGSAGDPTLHGATLTVYNAAGLTTDKVVVSLPPTGPAPGEGWTRLGTVAKPTGYRYRGTDPNGPIGSIVVKANSISVNGGKSNWSYTLDEPKQGTVALQLSLGAAPGAHWCAAAPAKSATNDKVDKFVAKTKTPAPASCPPTP